MKECIQEFERLTSQVKCFLDDWYYGNFIHRPKEGNLGARPKHANVGIPVLLMADECNESSSSAIEGGWQQQCYRGRMAAAVLSRADGSSSVI